MEKKKKGWRDLAPVEDIPIIRVRLNKTDYVIEMNLLLQIDQDDLNEELVRQPGKYAWVAFLYELASHVRNQKEHNVKRMYAHSDDTYRRCLEGKISENRVAQAIEKDEDYIDAVDDYLEWKMKCGLLGKACRAMEHRRDSLLALNVNLRKEWEG